MSKPLSTHPSSLNLVFPTEWPHAQFLDNALGSVCRTKAAKTFAHGRGAWVFDRLGHSGSEDPAFNESAYASRGGEFGEEKDTGGFAEDPGSGSRAGELGRKALEPGIVDGILWKNASDLRR